MRWSRYFLYTTKEEPSETEAVSHRLLTKAGFIKQVASGIYELTPIAFRVLKKIENIVRDEMDKAGAQELLLTILNPAELWKETGRWDYYGNELFKLKDRSDRDYCLGPTHEEEITDLVRKTVRSYKQLPLNLYQIHTKFRDEKRPRYGLIRGREFIMKDAYSFDTDEESAKNSYDIMVKAYKNIFKRLNLNVLMVKADVGQIGGKSSHEFVAITKYGEALIAYCENCGYAANTEIVELKKPNVEKEPPLVLEEVYTPNVKTIEELSLFLNVPKSKIIKSVLYIKENKPVMVLIRGDKKIDEKKLERLFGTDEFRLAEDEEVLKLLNTEKGFIGPFVEGKDIEIIVDNSLYNASNMVVAFNKPHYHYKNANIDFENFVDVAQVEENDPCPECGSPLKVAQGLELGHTFLLGTRYSLPMKAFFTDKDGLEKPIVMGCYGIGISRLIAAIVEQYHDEKGIKWPLPVAPFQVLISCVNTSDELQYSTSEHLYKSLIQEGIEVLFDDRDVSPGVKFNDADLVGIPYRIVVGKKAKDGLVEVVDRHTLKAVDVPIDKVLDYIKDILNVNGR